MSEGDDTKPEEAEPEDDTAAPEATEGGDKGVDEGEGDEETSADALEDDLEEDLEEDVPSGFKDKLRAVMGILRPHLTLIIAGVLAVTVLGGGGAGLYFSGVFTPEKPHEVTLALPGAPLIYELPRLTVDLKPSPKRRRPFIRLVIQAELQGETAKAAFVARETRILDAMHAHLRTLTVEDLQGEEGTQRLRKDLILIIERLIRPERVLTVLFKEILIR